MTITREHLELAALAAGKRVAAGYVAAHDDLTAIVLESGEEWRPHLDEADTARLAVRLNFWAASDRLAAFVAQDEDEPNAARVFAKHDGTEPDKPRAWREAVVLCAAAVGKKMKGGA